MMDETVSITIEEIYDGQQQRFMVTIKVGKAEIIKTVQEWFKLGSDEMSKKLKSN